MITKVGTRVGAILGVDEATKVLKLFGYGVYNGQGIPPSYRELFKGESDDKIPKNPEIKLDDGSLVYGRECWWSSQEHIEKEVARHKEMGYKIVMVDVAEFRKEEAAEWSKQDEPSQ